MDNDTKGRIDEEFLEAQLERLNIVSRDVSSDISWPAYYLQFRVDPKNTTSWNAKTLAQIAAHVESIEEKSFLGVFSHIQNTMAKSRLDQCKKELRKFALSTEHCRKGANKVACGERFNKLLEDYSVAFLEAMEALAVDMQKQFDTIEPYIEQEVERLCALYDDFVVTDTVVENTTRQGKIMLYEHWLGAVLVEDMVCARKALYKRIRQPTKAAKNAPK